jgi:hypothetical protein
MTELALLVPSTELARLTDPLVLARDLQEGDGPVSRQRVLDEAQRRVSRAVQTLALPDRGARADSRCYAVAAALLDERAHPGRTASWLNRESLPTDDSRRSWLTHVSALSRYLTETSELGAVPADLDAVLAYVGVAGPGCCSLRAITRSGVHPDATREAMRLANGLRLMFNLPDAVAIVRGFATSRSRIQTRDSEVFWRAVLDYCFAGNLQAASLTARDIAAVGTISAEPITFRSRFALRLDKGHGEDEKTVHRVDTVRKAFNSPFWPLVLATTSIGQEGLDFHLYSHGVVHWNLPHNPVHVEQREAACIASRITPCARTSPPR